MARRRQLVGMLAAERNRVARSSGKALESIKTHITWLNKQIDELDDELKKLVKKTPLWRERDVLFQSVPGVGPGLSYTIIADLPELGHISSRALSKLVGIAPLNSDSGRHQGRRKIWGGRAKVRAALYMSTVACLRWNPVIRAYFERLIKGGKEFKVALVACMRRLLAILNAMARTNTKWNPGQAAA